MIKINFYIMKRFKTFIIFIILVATWGIFFASFKYFLWGDLGDSLKPDLQKIAGYMSLGGVFAYLIGGAFASTFLKKYYLFIISIFTFIFLLSSYLFGFSTNTSFAFIITLIGFLYGLWNVVKSVLISMEIKKTGLRETVVNAYVGMVFVIFLIVGSILGNLIFEKLGHNGYIVLMGLMLFGSIISFNLDYDKIPFSFLTKNGWKIYLFGRKESLTKAIKAYIPDLKYIVKKYLYVIIGSSLLWAITTIVSQSSVEYSVNTFGIEASKASFLLLYSAVGAIAGNILSMKMNTNRWKFFIIFNTLFSFVIIAFPFFAKSFLYINIMASILGIFFGIISNLVDSYLMKSFGDENKKEYGASTNGLVLSLVIVCMMFVSSSVLQNFGYQTLMISLGSISFVMGGVLFVKQRNIK
ncbi:MAG: MFS transporter [Candidatus Gracilibacteria bacterium]